MEGQGRSIRYQSTGASLELSLALTGHAQADVSPRCSQVIFLRQPPLPPSSVQPSDLNTLTVPFSNFLDTRYMIPVFSSPYYEASIIPVPGGGLPEMSPAGSSSSSSSASTTSAFVQAKGRWIMHFNEGRGMEWRQAVEEVKARAEEMHGRAQHMEDLPLYEPPPGASSSMDNAAAGSTSTAGPAANAAAPRSEPSMSAGATGSSDRPRRPTEPEPEIMQVAGVAVELEEREREAEQRDAIVGGGNEQRDGEERCDEPSSGGAEGGRTSHATMLHPGDSELPPAYEL